MEGALEDAARLLLKEGLARVDERAHRQIVVGVEIVVRAAVAPIRPRDRRRDLGDALPDLHLVVVRCQAANRRAVHGRVHRLEIVGVHFGGEDLVVGRRREVLVVRRELHRVCPALASH